jgi:hypothetical protein
VHRVRPVERPRRREPHITSLQADDAWKPVHPQIHPMFAADLPVIVRFTAPY